MHPVVHLVAEAAQQVTQNPNAADTWINRLSLLVPIFLAIGVAGRWLSKQLHAAIDERVLKVETALKTHTDQEASIVEGVVSRQLGPVIAAQSQLTTAVATLSGSVATLTMLATKAEDRATG